MTKRWLTPALATMVAVATFASLSFVIHAVLATGGNRAAAGNPHWRLWSSLLAASVVACSLVFWRSLHVVKGWRQVVGVRLWWPMMIYALAADALLVFLWGNVGRGIAGLSPHSAQLVSKMALLVGVAAMAPAMVGLWLVHCRLRGVSDLIEGRATEPKRAADVLADLIDCRRDQSTCLSSLAVLVSIAVIDAGAQRRAFLATGVRPEQFPAEAVLFFGALLTLASLLLYVPVFISWRTHCQQFVDEVYPLPEDARPNDDWVSGRTRLNQLLGADASVAKNLTTAFGILVPLGTSILSVVLPGLK